MENKANKASLTQEGLNKGRIFSFENKSEKQPKATTLLDDNGLLGFVSVILFREGSYWEDVAQ
jgi:hypothetical protein